MIQRIALTILVALSLCINNAYADREITITEGHLEPIPIAINSFSASGAQNEEIAKKLVKIIENDLKSCSFFKIIPSAAFIETATGISHRPSFASWRQINAQLLLNGQVERRGDKLEISFIISDPVLEKDLHKEVFELPMNIMRRSAHKIADTIYERATGDKGYFNTRVAYIAQSGNPLKPEKRLAIMDFDGENHKYLTDGRNLVLTPRFSPNADKVLYLAYVKNTARVYIKDIKTGREHIVGDFPGMSFAPKFSPDGTRALMSVAKNGVTNILEYTLQTRQTRKITNGFVINTSPSYSPDGRKIVFNSNRSGSKQLYVMDADGSNVERISFGTGSYFTPVWSPKGDFIAFTKQQGNNFNIGVMRPDGSQERLIASGYLVEGPTWSPSGRIVMFTRESKRIGHQITPSSIYMVDVSGHNLRRLPTMKDASDPEWSTLLD